jgi:predicted outer membrane repeat protein
MSFLFVSSLLVAIANAQMFLSSFGNDANDCATSSTACRSLTRGVAAIKASTQSPKVLSLDASVFSLTGVTIDFPLVVRGAGRLLTSIGCQSGASTGLLSVTNLMGTVRFESLALDSCPMPVQLGRSASWNIDRRVEFEDVFFRNTDGGIECITGRNTVVINNSQFSPSATSNRPYVNMVSNCDAMFVEVSGSTTFAAIKHGLSSSCSTLYAIQMSTTSTYPRALRIRPGVKFGSTSDSAVRQFGWISQFSGVLLLNGTTFTNRGTCDCAIRTSGVDVQVFDSQFAGARNYSSLCVLGSTGIGAIQTSVFDDNEAQNAGGAISVTDAQLAIRSSTFRNNRALRSGGAISCSNARLTVLMSTFIGNSAPDAAIASCSNCPKVFDQNSASGNQETTSMLSCNISTTPAAPTPLTPVSNAPPSTPIPFPNGTPSPNANVTPSPNANVTPSPNANGTPTTTNPSAGTPVSQVPQTPMPTPIPPPPMGLPCGSYDGFCSQCVDSKVHPLTPLCRYCGDKCQDLSGQPTPTCSDALNVAPEGTCPTQAPVTTTTTTATVTTVSNGASFETSMSGTPAMCSVRVSLLIAGLVAAFVCW